jgi:hypothetical protein
LILSSIVLQFILHLALGYYDRPSISGNVIWIVPSFSDVYGNYSLTVDDLAAEAIAFLAAAQDATANALIYSTFYVLNNPTVLSKLQEELLNATPDR